MNKTDEFVCVNCLCSTPSLFVIYSQDVIRITECKQCGSVVDKYVEYDIPLIIIDLILQYKSAYRHVLINMKFKSFVRIIFIFILCDAYKAWIEQRHQHQTNIFDLEWRFYECLLISAIEFVAYACTLCLLLKIGRFKQHEFLANKGRRFLIESALVSFYGSLFIVFSIIWQLHGQVLYKLLTQSFLFISHLQMQRALYPEYGFRNIAVILLTVITQSIVGYYTKIIVDHWSDYIYLTSS